jgi:hypothetical protein
VIHFNRGLHDIKVGDSGKCWVSPEDYETNLRRLVEQLKATGTTLIWATTTPVPSRVEGIQRRNASVIAYNALAKKVMDEKGIAVDDLYSLALPQLATIQLPANVHYTPSGLSGPCQISGCEHREGFVEAMNCSKQEKDVQTN